MRYIITISLMLTMLHSCSSTTAMQASDGTILIAKRGSILKTFPEDTKIQGAISGRITPASKLRVSHTTYLKGRHIADVSCEGYIDLTKPGQVEVRLVRLSTSAFGTRHVYQMSTNGEHRLRPEKTEVSEVNR